MWNLGLPVNHMFIKVVNLSYKYPNFIHEILKKLLI
jgi:hypothetical protein